MALSRLKVWIADEDLNASDLNAEYNNIINNPISLISPLTGSLDSDGQTLTLDAAAVTTVVSSAAVSWNFTSGAKTGTPATTGSIFNYSAQTFTDNATAASGTAASYVACAIQRPTLAATNLTVTTTDAATFYIPNNVAAGTNQTITNSWALWIDAGNVRFDDDIIWRSGTAFNGTFAHNISAARTWTFPDVTGTITTSGDNLSVFAATTSAQLAGVISDETGSGALVFATSPALVTPVLGTPTSGTLSNCTVATTTAAGVVEHLTQAEYNAGTDTSRTPTANLNRIALATEQASTAGTSIDFTGIPAGVRRIEIKPVGMSTNGISALLIQLGDAGGIETTGYTSNVGNHGGSLGSSTAGFIVIFAMVAASTLEGIISLSLEDSSDFTWSQTAVITVSGQTVNFSGGSKALSAELDRIRVTTVNGTDTFDAGTINISYER